jgi:uncharacterized membrane protein YqiK
MDTQIDSATIKYALLLAGLLLVGFLFLIALLKSMLQICPPNEVLIFSGRRRRLSDGSSRGFRTVLGGRGFRVPVIETVSRMSVNTLEVPIAIRGAYSKGGIPLNVDAIANVKSAATRSLLATPSSASSAGTRAKFGAWQRRPWRATFAAYSPS